MKKIEIDKDKCIGCHKCKQICYTVFEVDRDGKAKVREEISQGDIEDARSAEISCPTDAIQIVETLNDDNDDDSLLDIFFK